MPDNNFNKRKKISMTYGPDDAYIDVDETTIVSVAKPNTGIIINKDSGTHISGDLSIKDKPENIVISQIYKLNNMMMSLLPSTIYTPIPVFKQGYTDKVKQFGKIADYVRELKGLLGAM